MENSSISKEKRNMIFRGREISLGMIESVWRESLEGVNIIALQNLLMNISTKMLTVECVFI